MNKRRNEATLAEARRIAQQPIEDRLEGKQGDEARSVILRLLEDAGMDFGDGLRLLGAFDWHRWSEGYNSGWEAGRKQGV